MISFVSLGLSGTKTISMKKLLFIILYLLPFLSLQLSSQTKTDSLYQKGTASLQSYQFGDALNYFFECQREDPFNVELLSKVGLCYFQLGNLMEARNYFSQAVKTDSVHLFSLNYLATIEEQMLEYESALSRIEQLIAIDSMNSYYFRSAGNLSERLGRLGIAVGYFERAYAINPNDQSALISLCDLYAKSMYLDYADSLLTDALRKQPQNLRLIYASATVNYRLRQYEEVLPLFESALEKQDTNLRHLPLYAYSLAQLEKSDEAIPWLEYLAERVTPDEQIHYFLGFCLWKSEADAEKSMEHYEKAVELGLSPNLGVYHQRMGDIMGVEKRHRSALKNYELAQNYGNNDPVIHFHMAVAFDHVYEKDKKRPLKCYQDYLKNYNGKNEEFRAYAQKRVDEITYYEEVMWKGN